VEIQNEARIDAPAAVVYRVLTDPEYLQKTMPGLKSLTPTADGRYDAVLEIGVAAVRGRYQGTMAIVDQDPPNGYRLLMEGKGPGAFVKLSMGVNLAEGEPGHTVVAYKGDAQVGGTLAGVGQRMIAGVAQMILGQFFQAVGREAVRLAAS
jgi:carbon monoxide dehydrogenase subunit G